MRNIIAEMFVYAEACSHIGREKERLLSFLPSQSFLSIENIDDYGFIAESEKKIVFSFRGTKKSLQAWVENFDCFPLREDEPHPIKHDGTIHDGFYQAWSYFKQIVTDYLRPVKYDYKIFCTGHSRGGVLATLCARHIAKNLGRPVSCVSFAAPMQGISAYRDQYNALPIYHTRVEVEGDIVTSLPPHALGFRPVGIPLIFKRSLIERMFFGRIRGHYYSTYAKGLLKYLGVCADSVIIQKVLDTVVI